MAHAGGGIAAGMQARQLARVRMNVDPGTVLAGQIAPGAAAAQHVEDAIGDPAYVRGPRSAVGLAGWDEGSEQCSFFVVEITGLHWNRHAVDALRNLREIHVPDGVSSGWLLLVPPLFNHLIRSQEDRWQRS